MSLEHRIAEPVGVSEVLLGRRDDRAVVALHHDRGQVLIARARPAVARQHAHAADRIAQRLDLLRPGVELGHGRTVGVRLSVQRDQHVHRVRVDDAGRLRCLAPHLVPGIEPARAAEIVAEHRRALDHAVDELVGHAAQRSGRNAECDQAVERERDVDGDLGPRRRHVVAGRGLRPLRRPTQRGRDRRQQGGNELASQPGLSICNVMKRPLGKPSFP